MQLIYLCLPTMMLTTVLALPTGNKVDSMDKRQGPGSLYGIYNAYNMYGNVDGTTASDDTYGSYTGYEGSSVAYGGSKREIEAAKH